MRKVTPALLFPLLLAGCGELAQDDIASQGGISPDPTALVEGTILYAGPRPTCVWTDGKVERVLGNVILTMYEFDNSPPPEGSASSAVNLLAVSGDTLFNPEDCLPERAVPNYAERITRSVVFRWPRIVLRERAADYQIRGFYDYDGDLIPFFSTTRLPTGGDVVGAAPVDLQDPSKGLYKLSLPPIAEAANGVRRDGLTVVLGNVVWTERPAFQLSAQRRLPGDAPFIPVLDAASETMAIDAAATLRSFRRLTCAAGDASEGCGLTLQRLPMSDAVKLKASAVDLELTSDAYAFFAEPVDFRTIAQGRVDTQVPDRQPDPHPVLGGIGVPWFTPMVLLQRIVRDPPNAVPPPPSLIERDSRIPAVLMVGSVLLDAERRPTKSSYNEAPISVAPVAAVELWPGRPECRVPYFPPGTPAAVYRGRVAHCAELPTGHYGVSVLSGAAGGQLRVAEGSSRGDSPRTFEGARYSGQAWSIPNELANETQTGGAANVIASQGMDGTFIVHDPSPGKGQCAESNVPICANDLLFSESPIDGLDVQTCLPRYCCEAVAHLCNVPLCPVSDSSEGRVAQSPSSAIASAGGRPPVPNCVPFEIPPQCCR
jgi:hypothetical protein